MHGDLQASNLRLDTHFFQTGNLNFNNLHTSSTKVSDEHRRVVALDFAAGASNSKFLAATRGCMVALWDLPRAAPTLKFNVFQVHDQTYTARFCNTCSLHPSAAPDAMILTAGSPSNFEYTNPANALNEGSYFAGANIAKSNIVVDAAEKVGPAALALWDTRCPPHASL